MGAFVRKCRVVSAQDMRKKGHVLVECEFEDMKSVHIVTDRPNVAIGSSAIVALAGATLDGQILKPRKIAGEWSEGVILEIVEEHEPEIHEIEDANDEHKCTEGSDDDDDDVSNVAQVLPPATVVETGASMPQH